MPCIQGATARISKRIKVVKTTVREDEAKEVVVYINLIVKLCEGNLFNSRFFVIRVNVAVDNSRNKRLAQKSVC